MDFQGGIWIARCGDGFEEGDEGVDFVVAEGCG